VIGHVGAMPLEELASTGALATNGVVLFARHWLRTWSQNRWAGGPNRS
jgi:hypothetical protein